LSNKTNLSRQVRIVQHWIPIYTSIIGYCYISHLYRRLVLRNATNSITKFSTKNEPCLEKPGTTGSTCTCTNLSILVPDIGTVIVTLFILTGHVYIATFILLCLLTLLFLIVTVIDIKNLLCDSYKTSNGNESLLINMVDGCNDERIGKSSKDYLVIGKALTSSYVQYWFNFTKNNATDSCGDDDDKTVLTCNHYKYQNLNTTSANDDKRCQQRQQSKCRKKAMRTILRPDGTSTSSTKRQLHSRRECGLVNTF
jgi:hypothetical protein